MKLPEELTTVTRLSKFVALIMFLTLPVIAFKFGMNYEKAMEDFNSPQIVNSTACTTDAKLCPDGSSVGRVRPKCDFADCPIRSSEQNNYSCPTTEHIDCSAPKSDDNKECLFEFLNWAIANCPNFKGAVL